MPFWPKAEVKTVKADGPLTGVDEDTENLHPMDVGLTLAAGAGALFLSNLTAEWTGIPSIIVITVLALVIAQLPIAKQIKGAQTLGMFSVYLFLAVIGAFCNVEALSQLGTLGVVLLGLALITVIIHGIFTFGAARVFRIDLDMAAVVSQANVGGGTSALALARSMGRQDLVLPAVLLGSLGNAVGTFLGFWAAGQLLPWLG